MLGWIYENGLGVAKDYRAAMFLYRQAAEKGDADAQNNLGGLYEFGMGVARDREEARRWYRKGAAQGHEPAIRNLERLSGLKK
jgi:TPR repeat protein